MCFSATASFSSSAVLFSAGVYSIYKVSKPSQLMLAATPLIFSIQQFSEGILWTCLQKSDLLCQQIASRFYITFAQSFWPLWLSVAVLLLEKEPFRRKILGGISFIGVLISVYLLYYSLTYGLKVKIIDHHLAYAFGFPDTYLVNIKFAYLIPTVFSNFVSSIKKIQILGLLMFIALIVTKILFSQASLSVWCFFAAGISAYILFIVSSDQKEMLTPQH